MSEGSNFRSNFRICIVGAGIVGLAGALFLHRCGFQVTVLERDTALRTSGAGIQLQPNAGRVLKDLGVLDKIRARCVHPQAFILKTYRTGQVLHTQDLVGPGERYNAPVMSTHRGHLCETLYAEAIAQGIEVRFGVDVDVSRIDLENGVLRLSEQSGNEADIKADLFLGADGGRSVVREALIGHPEMVPHDYVVNRILVDEDRILANPRLKYLIEEPSCVVWLGPDSQAVTYGLNGVYNIAFTWPWSTEPDQVLHKPQAIDMDDFKSKIASWDPALRELIDLSKDGMRFTMYEPKVNDDKTPWVSDSGKFCLIGDAAHQILPYLAQGCAIGLESVSTLACLLGKAETPEQVRDCLDIYQRLHKERAGPIGTATVKNGRYWQMADGPLKEERDRELLQDTPTAGCPNLLADPFFQEWLWGFDCVEAADRAWSIYASGNATRE